MADGFRGFANTATFNRAQADLNERNLLFVAAFIGGLMVPFQACAI